MRGPSASATAITRDSSVFSMLVKTLTISGQVVGYRLIVTGPMASACVSAAATGGDNMIPRPSWVVQRRGARGVIQMLCTGMGTSFWPR